MGQSQNIDVLMGNLGDFGPYQLRQFLLHILSAFTAGLHMLVMVTVAAVPEYQCMIQSMSSNESDSSWVIAPQDRILDKESCSVLNFANVTAKCDHWSFNKTYYENTRAVQWNMVCDRKWMGSMAQMSYMFGVFTGAVVLGSLADKFGRKKIFCFSAIMQLIVSVGIAFVNNYWLYVLITYVYGIFGSSGAYISGFVLSMELVGPSVRSLCGILFQMTFAVGIMVVAGWGYLIRDIFLLQIIYGLHSLLLIPHIWLVDESPRWLWGQGRKEEVLKIIQKALKINKKNVSLSLDIDQMTSLEKENEEKKSAEQERDQSYSILDLFKTPNMRKNSLNVCLFWFSASFGYYGISLRSGKLSGNPYFTMFVMAAVEIPSYMFVIVAMDRLGRRFLNSSMMIIGGVSLLSSAFFPADPFYQSVSTSVVFVGKFCIAGAFAVIYNYTVELFPTVVRNTALGLGSMFARLAAGFTPLVTLLDSYDKRAAIIIFALVTLIAGVLSTVLPETLNKTMPQTMQDGEEFGQGDTCYSTGCFGRSKILQTEKDIPLQSY